MTEVEKLHGLHNTGMTMHERFTHLARQAVGYRGKVNHLQARSPRVRGKGRTNPAFIEAVINQLNQVQRPLSKIPFQGRGRGREGLRRYGSEGSLWSFSGQRRVRSNSFGYVDQNNEDHSWRRSNGNLSSHASSYAGSVNGSVYSAGSASSRGYWLRGNAAPRRAGRGGGRGRGWVFRGRVHQGRVNRVMEQPAGGARPPRGSGRRGVRRNVAQAARGQRRGRGFTRGWAASRGRGRGGISHNQTPKPVPTKEELDAQLDQYMAGTKAALDKELDEYMRNAMDFE